MGSHYFGQTLGLQFQYKTKIAQPPTRASLPPAVRIALEWRASVLPVVHEQVRHPQLLGVDAHLVDVAVLRPVPRQVVVRPVLSQ